MVDYSVVQGSMLEVHTTDDSNDPLCDCFVGRRLRHSG